MASSREQAKVNEQLKITQDLLESIADGYKKIDSVVKPITKSGNEMVAAAQAEFKTRTETENLSKSQLKSLKSQGKSLAMIEEVYDDLNDNIDDIIKGTVKAKTVSQGFIDNLDYGTALGGTSFMKEAAEEAQLLSKTLSNPKVGHVFKAVDKGADSLKSAISSFPGGNFISEQFNIGPGIDDAAKTMKGNFLNSIKAGGNGFSGMLKGTKLLKIGLAGVALAAASFALEANKAQRDLGTSLAQTSKILATSKAVAAANKLNGMTQEDTVNIIKGIATEFGSFSDATAGATLQASNLVANFGLSADSVGTLARQMQAVGEGSLESALNSIELQANMARAADVPVADVMNDVAKNTDFFAKFAKDGGANITAAAIAAKKLGLEMSNVVAISESLLNFEDSIQKQMEAEVLLGKELNLEKAREMVFNNDIAGAMQEISQLVSPEEFEAMDAVRRQALAASVGLDAGAMAKAISGGAAGGGITSAMRTGGAPAGGGGTDKMDMLIGAVNEGNANMVRAVQSQGVN